jgi:hydroxymethylpyrimidine pyrophosphatase-like HAD family hydrolase
MADLFIDIDGTLIDKDDNIRPFVSDLLIAAKAKGFSIFIWSGGGVEYAKEHIKRIYKKFELHIPYCVVPKDFIYVRFKDFRSVCIDDTNMFCDEFREFGGHGYKVSSYDVTCYPYDRELKDIAEKL